MPLAATEDSDIPEPVLAVLKTSKIGYLSVRSEKGDLYTYPVAFLFSGRQVYTMTPISAAKLRFMKANPDVSFLVENKGLTLGAVGAMVQGTAKIYSIAKTVSSILSIGPNMAKYAKKYPSQFTFYARGKYLPDERKLYKYRFIRIRADQDSLLGRVRVRAVQGEGWKARRARRRVRRREDGGVRRPDEGGGRGVRGGGGPSTERRVGEQGGGGCRERNDLEGGAAGDGFVQRLPAAGDRGEQGRTQGHRRREAAAEEVEVGFKPDVGPCITNETGCCSGCRKNAQTEAGIAFVLQVTGRTASHQGIVASREAWTGF